MIDNAEFSVHLATIRTSITDYRRSRTGGMVLTMVVDDDDKHEALDLVDGGELMVKLEVYGVPRPAPTPLRP